MSTVWKQRAVGECGVFVYAAMRQKCVHAYFTFENKNKNKNTTLTLAREWFAYLNSILCLHKFQIHTCSEPILSKH